MKSPITRLNTAAAAIIAVVVGAMSFVTSIDGTSVVSAEVVPNVEPVRSAIMQEKRTFTCDGREVSFLNSDAVRYYSSEYGAREDMRNAEGLLLHQVYWLIRENVRIRVVPPMEQYERDELTEVERTVWGQPGVRPIVDLLKAEKPTPLGRRKINGREAEGFRITGSGGQALIPIQLDRGVVRFWMDVETSLPVRYEAELLTSDKLVTSMTDGKPVGIAVTGYEFQWNAEIEPSLFEPNIPRDYTILKLAWGKPELGIITRFGVAGVAPEYRRFEFPHGEPPDISWPKDLEDLEYIHTSREGVSIVPRKQLVVDIAAFQLQCRWEDLKDFYDKLDICFTGTSNASPGDYAILSREVVRQVFEVSESSDVFALRARSTLKAGNGHKCLFGVSNLGAAVLGPVQRYREQHVDLSFSFFPYAWLEHAETPGVNRASVDIPSVRIGPREAVLMRYANPAGAICRDGGNAQNDSMERIVMLLVQIAGVQK